eukprot:TRINITY_DN67576_c0_g1_i1.p1 TRINITY_DN67576_c0_g1~~TRINITY_DN67576_c0_g1_i1.p1  ORF type:complete len:406 (+),score=79.27 TRINITY_DN67576_c0_g1_i1:147-1364(+)
MAPVLFPPQPGGDKGRSSHWCCCFRYRQRSRRQVREVALAVAAISISIFEGDSHGEQETVGSFGDSSSFGQAAEVDALRLEVQNAWRDAGGRCLASRSSSANVGSTSGTAGWSVHGSDAAMAPGCKANLLLPALRLVYGGPEESGAILDVGAYVGGWTAEVLSVFGNLESRKYAKEFGTDDGRCGGSRAKASVSVYCFEPAKKNYERLSDRAKRSAWQLEGFQLMRAGVTNVTGKANVFASVDAIDPEASLFPREGVPSIVEKSVTLDLLLKKSVKEGRAFLIRVAVNGHEHQALRGAKKSLKNGLVRFVLFEVSPLAAGAGNDLGGTVRMLWKVGYACFALLPRPVPLSGPFWRVAAEASAAGEGPEWFHVFCGKLEDFGLRRVLRSLDPEGRDILPQPAISGA